MLLRHATHQGWKRFFEFSFSELSAVSLPEAKEEVSAFSCDGAESDELMKSSGTLLHAHRMRRSDKTNKMATIFFMFILLIEINYIMTLF